MEQYQHDQIVNTQKSLGAQFVRVYSWMFLGLLVTGITSLIAIQTPLLNLVTNRISFIALILIEFGVVWFLSSRALNMSYGAAAMSFIGYSILNGVTLSLIFFVYTFDSIAYVFFITAIFFGFMSLYGIVTKQDLTSMGSLFMMGLIGIIVASVANWFLQSSTLYWIISFIGVAVFLGLTAYDSQKIKNIHAAYEGTPKEKNVAIVGALELYLDFVNLFLYVLRILGKKK